MWHAATDTELPGIKMRELKDLRIKCLRIIIRPVIGFCLKHSISIQELFGSAKVMFLEVAAQEMEKTGQKANVSRLSIATGLARREVMRIHREGEAADFAPTITERVIGQWEQDARFTTKAGTPRVLPLDQVEFNELVGLVSKDIHPSTVLSELERLQLVERTSKGFRLKRQEFQVQGDPEEVMRILARDIRDLVAAANENAFENPGTRNLHARTEYDNISPDSLPEIRNWLLSEGAAYHHKVRNYLAQFDLDINPKANTKGGARVSFGTFGHTEERKKVFRKLLIGAICLTVCSCALPHGGYYGGGTIGSGIGSSLSDGPLPYLNQNNSGSGITYCNASGTVFASNGKPPSSVTIMAETDSTVESTVTDNQGSYSLLLVAKPGESVTLRFKGASVDAVLPIKLQSGSENAVLNFSVTSKKKVQLKSASFN